jgi:hypothetical protein
LSSGGGFLSSPPHLAPYIIGSPIGADG